MCTDLDALTHCFLMVCEHGVNLLLLGPFAFNRGWLCRPPLHGVRQTDEYRFTVLHCRGLFASLLGQPALPSRAVILSTASSSTWVLLLGCQQARSVDQNSCQTGNLDKCHCVGSLLLVVEELCQSAPCLRHPPHLQHARRACQARTQGCEYETRL